MLNANDDISFNDLKEMLSWYIRIQMTCPEQGVENLSIQTRKVNASFEGMCVIVFGLDYVFENHKAMIEFLLRAFLPGYKISFPADTHIKNKLMLEIE